MTPLQICEHKDCDYEPYQQPVGSIATWYCCKKGFFKSLEQFSKHIANKHDCHLCNDKQTIKHRGETIPCPAGCYLKTDNQS